MKVLKYYKQEEKEQIIRCLERAAEGNSRVEEIVQAIGDLVKKQGDEALTRLNILSDPNVSAAVRAGGAKALLKAVDGAMKPGDRATDLKVSPREISEAESETPKEVLTALKKALFNIRSFHEKLIRGSWENRTGKKGEEILLGQIYNAVASAGLYVPGGRAPLVSTVLMTAIPAWVAGVPRRVMTTPASREGKINPALLAAASLCKVDAIYKVGGAQAIFALAYGTQTVPKVDRIAGPGNAFVAEALRQVQGRVGVESIPGPSEILIVADDSADAAGVALDLLAQAEHDEDAVPVLVSFSKDLTRKVIKELESRVKKLERKAIAEGSLKANGLIVEVQDREQAMEVVDLMAPEHLEILLAEGGEGFAYSVKNAGAILVGPYSPVALSDYFAGPSHVLPTGGTARFASGITVDTFLKKSSVTIYSGKALKDAAPYITTLARLEGLTAHANSVDVRLKSKKQVT